jgi:hypothetical protein
MGWTFVEAALAAEYHVMTFNRGRTGADVPGVDVMRGDRESVSDLARLAAQGAVGHGVRHVGLCARRRRCDCARAR